MWEKEKLLVTSNFSFSQCFKRLVSQGRQKVSLCGNWLSKTSVSTIYVSRSILMIKPITRRQILDSSKLREFAEDNFKFDENGRKLSKQVENTVGKGEIVHYEQFLLFPQCFQKVCFLGASKSVIVWEWVNNHLHKVMK